MAGVKGGDESAALGILKVFVEGEGGEDGGERSGDKGYARCKYVSLSAERQKD